MTKKTITGAGGSKGSAADEVVNSALEMLSVRAWPGPERNTRIEEFIMDRANAGRPALSRKKLWLGGLMLLLAGSAIGAVSTRLVTYRFTGEGVDAEGNRFALEGEMQIEEQGEQKNITMSVDGLPPAGGLQSGELTLEDGRKVQIVPATEGMTVTVGTDGKPVVRPAAPGSPATPEAEKPAEAAKPEQRK